MDLQEGLFVGRHQVKGCETFVSRKFKPNIITKYDITDCIFKIKKLIIVGWKKKFDFNFVSWNGDKIANKR